MSRECCVALPHDDTVCLQFVIEVFSDHTHYFRLKDDYSTAATLNIDVVTSHDITLYTCR